MLSFLGVEINVLIEGKFPECPPKSWFQKIAEKVLMAQGAADKVELGLVITTQERIRELNRTYRGKDRTTDVLAFPMSATGEKTDFPVPPDGACHLGEVVISYPQAVIQAKERGHSVRKELAILVIHGVLHLLGYDDEKPDERRRMRMKEAGILASVPGGLLDE